jgi:hypothetical protein
MLEIISVKFAINRKGAGMNETVQIVVGIGVLAAVYVSPGIFIPGGFQEHIFGSSMI